MTTKNMKVQLRRDTASNWTTKNPTLLAGEMGIETDTKKFKFGDGVKTWTQLDYASTDSSATAWGDITGTLANQTDLSAVLDRKLEKTNFIQGSNIILTKNGNDITIAATGEISGGVEWGNVTGTLDAQADLQKQLNEVNKTASGMLPIEETTEYRTYALESGGSNMASGWYSCNKLNPGENGGILTGIYSTVALADTSTEYIELAILEADFVNQTYTCVKFLKEKLDFHTGTTVMLNTPVWVGPNQYVAIKTTAATQAKFVTSGPSDVLRIVYYNTPEIGVTKPFAGGWVNMAISLGCIFEVTSAPILNALPEMKYITDLYKEDHKDDFINSSEVGIAKSSTSVLYIPQKYQAKHAGKVTKLRIPDNQYTSNINISLAVCSYNSTTGKFTRKTPTPLVVAITPSTSEIVLDPALEVEAGDYIGMAGAIAYVNPQNPYRNFISGGNWTSLGTEFDGSFNRGESPQGFNFDLEYTTYFDPQDVYDAVDAIDDKVDQTIEEVDERTIIKDSSYLGNVDLEPITTTWSIGAWAIGRADKATANGKITKVEFDTSVATDTVVLIGAFLPNNDATSSTLQRYIKTTLPANATTLELSTPLEIHAGECVGTNVGNNSLRKYKGSDGSGYYSGGESYSKDPQTIGQTVNFLSSWATAKINTRFTFVAETVVTDYAKENRELINSIIDNPESSSGITVADMNKVMLMGSSLTAAFYSPKGSAWTERVNDFVDVNLMNFGVSGSTSTQNMNALIANGATVEGISYRDIKPTYIMWDNSANGSETGTDALIKYRQMKEIVDSYGAKLLMGSEENWADGYNSYEHTQQAFANEVKVPYSPVGRLDQWAYPRDTAHSSVCPYPVRASGHASYRANACYFAHTEMLGALPINKNIKMFRVRPTYKAGSPTIADLIYDTNIQRLRYWTAISPGASTAGFLPGHIDNYDKADGSYDVPDTTNQGGSSDEVLKIVANKTVTFNKYALIEFILDKVNITKGTFTIKSTNTPTKVYVAKSTNTSQTYTDGYVRSSFVEVPFELNMKGYVEAVLPEDTTHAYQLYDKVKIVVYYSGGDFSLSDPGFSDYDGEKKTYDTEIKYHRRKFGTELLTDVNPSTWTMGGTSRSASLPAPIANYTLYNNTASHAELRAEGDAISYTETLSEGKYRKVAVRVVGQIWNKIATTRFNGTEYESSEYIANTKTDPLGLAAYTNSDYDYGTIRVSLGYMTTSGTPEFKSLISKDLLMLPGWYENYFEADLTPDDTKLTIKIEKKSFVDNSYTNDDKPIFIHHVSVQEIE